MDNVTHTLTGLALARAGFNRIGTAATTVLILAANAPDLDIVVAPQGALRYLAVHRGYTHSLLGAPLMAALSVLVAWCFFRKRLRWFPLWGAACVGIASHLLLDWTNSYGIRLFLPFSSRWSYGDLNNLTDGVVLCVLALAALWPSFAGLVTSEMSGRSSKTSRGRGIAMAALAFFVLFDIGRFLLHERALSELGARLYGGAAPTGLAALPQAFNPFVWNGIVETEDSFRTLEVNALSDLDPSRASVLYKIPVDPAIRKALTTEPFRFFVYFARFPAWSEQPVLLPTMHATRIDLTDLRFGAPGQGAFHCVALVDAAGRLHSSTFTYGSGASLGLSDPRP